MKTNNERAKQYRERQKAANSTQKVVWLDAELWEELEFLKRATGNTQQQILQQALRSGFKVLTAELAQNLAES